MRRARWKRKNVRDELTGKAANSPKTGTGRHELLTELETPLPAALYLNLKSVRRRIWENGTCRAAKRTPSASLFAAAPPVQLREEFPKGRGLALVPRPSSLVPRPLGRSFQRGGPQPAPLCHEGAWGTGGVPHVSGGGLRGRDLCAQGPFPLPRSGNCPLREQTVLSDFQIK